MTGIIILAAGGSSRLGQPKQNLIYHGKSLLQNAVTAAVNASIGPVILVLGAGHESLKKEIEGCSVHVVVNAEWKEGMSTSIKCGLTHLMQLENEPENALLMLCDQPFVNSELLITLLNEKKRTGKKVIACTYNHTIGVPAIFDSAYFTELLFLTGNEGAKKLLYSHRNTVGTIAFPEGSVDIDTPEDYEKLHQLSINEIADNGINKQSP